jgi:hypothetical protein
MFENVNTSQYKEYRKKGVNILKIDSPSNIVFPISLSATGFVPLKEE